MLTFHEGLPGSGKSYAAVQDYLLPAVNNGQKVFTNIKGIDHAAIAAYCKIEVERAKELVIQIPWEETKNAAQLVENDSLVIIDEVQDFWPQSNKPLSQQDSEFVTQHRQRGLELVACGQVMKDCHALWKRRVERKVMFTNQEAIGKPTKYAWISYNAPTPENFEQIASGSGEYKPEVYACYRSVAAGVQRLDKTKDDRFNPIKALFGSKLVLLYLLAFPVGLYFIYQLFQPDNAAKKPPVVQNQNLVQPRPIRTNPPVQAIGTQHAEESQLMPTGRESNQWRLVGRFRLKGKDTFLAVNKIGQFRYISEPDALRVVGNAIQITIEGEELTTWNAP